MAEGRLERTRRIYVVDCGHKSQIVSEVVLKVNPDGTTTRERLSQRFRVRGDDARFCRICGQIVDAQDDQSARRIV